MPTVSVIIPTYNRRAYVQEAIDSVLAQTYTDYEIIVIDDGSTDGTGEALRGRYGDRITYEWQENQGESVARNRGIALAQGEYIAFLDSDDLWLPEKLEKQVAYLEEHPEVGAVIAQARAVDGDGSALGEPVILGEHIQDGDLSLRSLVEGCSIHNASMFTAKRDLIIRAGCFEPSIHHGEDWDLYLRISSISTIRQIPEVLLCARVHATNQWSSNTAELIQPRLHDNLRVVANGFALLPESEASKQSRMRVERRLYSEAAVRAIAIGDYSTANGLSTEAISRGSMSSTDSRALGDMLGRYYTRGDGAAAELTGRAWVDVLSNAIAALHPLLDGRRARRRAAQGLLPAVFFERARFRDRDAILWLFPRLIRADIRWASNRGVWSIGLRALCGDRVWAMARRILGSADRTHIEEAA